MVHSQHGDPINTQCLFFLDVGQMPAASRESIQFHMVSYCNAIKVLHSILLYLEVIYSKMKAIIQLGNYNSDNMTQIIKQ